MHVMEDFVLCVGVSDVIRLVFTWVVYVYVCVCVCVHGVLTIWFFEYCLHPEAILSPA